MSLPVWVEWIEVLLRHLGADELTSLPVWVEWIEVLVVFGGRSYSVVSTRLGRVD